MASKKKDSGAKTGTKATGAKTGGKKVESPFFNKPVTEISNANKFAQAVAPKAENKTIPSAPKTQTFKQAVESPASYAKNLEGTPSQDAVIRANTGKTQVYNTGKKKTLWEEKYGIILPKDFMKDMASVQNPYAGNRAVDAGNEAAALEARALTGEDRNPDHQKIADLRQEAEVNSSPYVKAYREAKNPKGRKETAAKFRNDNADELYLKPMLEGAKADYQRNKQKMPNGANADEYLRKIAPYRLRSKENKLTETEKREIAAIAEPFITRIDSGRFNSDDAKKLKKYLSAIADRVPDDDIAGSGFINALKNRVDSAGTVAKKAEEQKRTNENFEKYIAPALSNPRTYYFPKDASFDDYIDAADSIISQMYSGSGISEEEKAQLYSIITQYKAKIEKTVSKDDPNRNGYYRRMAEILNPNDSDRRDFFSEEDRTFLSWLEDKSLKEYTSVITAAQREKEQKKAQEEYKKYIAPVLSNPRTYYFPEDAKPSDYIRAAQKITNKMKWDGTSSDETKKQLYSIVEQFMLKYPDPDSKLLDKELRGEGRTKEECYLNMRYILGDRPGRSDGSYSEEDKKFVEYLSKKLSNEINITKADRQLEKAEEKNILWSGENSEGEKITLYRDKNFFNSNWKVGNYGIIASRMGDMYAKTGDKRFYDVALKFKQLSEGVAGANYEDINPDNIFLNIAANALQNFPLQLDQLKETGKIAAPLALLAVATGVGTIGGALKLAYTAGSVKSGFEIMRGDAMVSLTEMGLSYDDALKLANNEGFINALIESGDAVLDIISYGAGKAFSKQAVESLTKGVKKGAARTAATALTKLGLSEKGVKTILKGAAAAGAFALNVAGEGGEEWLQTSVSLANEDAAEAILSGDSNAGYESASNLVNRAFTRDYTKEEKAQRWEDFWGGVKGGLFFSGAHIAAGALLGGGTNFANSSAMNISSGEMVKTNNLEEQTLAESAKIQDKDVQKYRQKIVDLIASGQEVRTDEWGKLYNLAKAAEAKAPAETLKEQYRDLGKTSNFTFEQAREAMAKDPASETLDPGDAFLAFIQGRYEKKKGAAKKANVETESAKAVKTAKENEAETAKTTEKTAATDKEARSDIGKKSSGENKKRLLESLPEENREEAEYYWGLGRAGEEMKTVYDEPFAGGTLSDLERVQAWSAGKNDRKLYLEEVERESTYGLSDSDETRVNLNDIDKTTARFLDAAAKKLGVTVEIRGILRNSAGNRVGGFTEDGSGNITFTMNAAHKKLKGKALAMYFATHEFVHSVRIKSREAYNKLVNTIGAEILTDERIAAKIAEYAESNIEIDTEAAKEEIVAEYVGEALAKADKKTIHKIIGGRRNVAEVLLDLVNKLIGLFRNDKELREGYKNAREAIIEAMESIDRERAQRIKEGRTESTRSTDSAKENVKYAVQTDNKGGKYWEIDTEKDIFKGLKTKEEFRDAAFNFLIGNRDNKVVYEDKNGEKIKFIRVSAREFTRSEESSRYYKNDPETFNKKMRLIPSLEDLLLNYNVDWHSKDHKKHSRFKDNGFMNYRGRVKIDNTMFNYIVRVGQTNIDNVFYDINLEAVNSYVLHTKNDASRITTSVDDSVSQKGKTVNTYSTQTDEKYAVSDSYSREIDEWYKSGKSDNESFVLGSTGDVLQGLGAIESDIYMNSDKINKILDEHKEITVAEIKKIPEILEDPVLILKSQNKDRGGKQNTRLIIFGSVKGQDGRPVLSVLDLRPVENNLTIDDMQKVSSVYTKDNNPVEFIKASDIVYADKKRTANLLKSIGFQTPIELHHSGYIGSISYIKRSVNIKGEKFSDVFDTAANTHSMQTNEKYAASDDETGSGDGKKKEKYFKPGSNRARDIDIVSETENGRKNPRLMRNLAESQFTSEETASEIAEEARSGNYSFTSYSDKAAASQVNRWFASHGNDILRAGNDVLDLLKAGKVTDKTNVMKALLTLSKIEDKRMTGEVSPEISRLGEEIRRELYTASGETARALQAYSTAKKLSPEGEIEELERKVSDINKEHEKKAGDERWKKIEDAERGLKAADETVRDAEENADFIGRKVAEKERQIKETAKTHRDFREIDKEYLPIRDDADPEGQAKKFKKQIEKMKGKTAGTNEWLDAYNSYLADEFSKASKRLAEAREANRKAREERKRLEKAIPSTERKEYETFWKTELTKRDSEYLKGELAEASKRLAETNAELKKARDKYRELSKEVNRVKATMARREKSIALSNRKIADIRTETEKLLSDYAALLDEQAEAEAELTKARMSRKLAKELFEATNKYTKKKKIVLSEELRQKILNAKTEEEREELRKEAMKDIAGQLPPTVWESLRTWRYLAMLGNLRTHIRNCVGNTIQLTAVGTKNLIAGGISDIYFHGEGPGALNEYMEFLRADGGTIPAGSVNREDFNAVRGKNVGALTDSELESLKSPARKYYEEMGTKSPFFRAKSGDWREYDTTEVLTATKARRDEKGRPIVTGEVKNSDTGWSVIVSPRISEATEHGRGKAVERNAEYMPYIHDAVKKAVLVSSKISDSESGISLMEHDMYAYVTAKGRTELLKLTVEEKGSGSSGIRDYVLKDVAPVAFVKTEAGKNFTVADVFKKVKETDRDFEYKKADKSKLNKDGSVKTPKERYNTIVHSKFDKETRQWIYTLWKEQKSEIMSGGGGKYKGIMSEIEDLRKKAGPEIINWMAGINSGALEWEDGKFLLSNFYIAMRQYLSANKLNKNNITDEQLTRAIEHSTKEALEATYRDMNNLARFFRDMCKRSKVASFLIDATVPFTTTPFNIVKRAVEYSPLECLVMVKKGIDSAFGKGEYNAADVINDIAKMTSGTGLAALGACLYASGYLVIGDGSDDDDDYKKELGMQPFSIIINGTSYTLDWAAPAVIPLFMGAQITKLMSKASEDGELTAKEKVKAIETSIDVFLAPMLQMSVLTSLTDTVEAIRSGDSTIKGIAEVASQAVINYLGQYVPTALGQVARTVDPSTRRTVFVQKDAPFSDAEYFLKKQMGKIPGLSRLNPEYVDLFGETAPRKEGIGDYVQSALSNMVYPWYMADVTRTESDDELLRLSGTAAADGKKVLNYKPEKTVNIDIGGHTEKRALTEDEYFEIKKKMGQYGTAAIRELIKSDIYKDMSDEARAEATDFIWSTAETKAKADVVPDFYMSKEERIAQTLSGGDPEKLALWSAALAKEKLEEEEAKPDYTAEQQRKYDSSLEERFSALSDELTASPYWDDKSDEEKHDALTDLYSYSAAKARSEVEEGYELSGQNKKIASVEEKTGISPAEYLTYKLLEEDADTDGSGTLNQKEKSAALQEFALQNGASLSDVAFLWQMETDGVSRNNPWAAYLDPKYYKHSGKEKKTWDR